jgi:hypothetical protein
MRDQAHPEEICCEIAGELREIATWLSTGELSPEKFRQAVVALEEAKVNRFGFRLTGAAMREGGSRFELRFAGSGELCAIMEFDPETREISTEHLCS